MSKKSPPVTPTAKEARKSVRQLQSAKSVKAAQNTEEIEQLVKAIDEGKQDAALQILEKNPELINHQIGFAKLSLIQKAIYKSQPKLIDYLLKQPKLKLDNETLFHAINCGKEDLTEQILNEMDKRKLDSKLSNPTSWCFEPYMTPLLLASLMNNYEIVKLLRRRGHKIEIPHRADCACVKCDKERKGGEDLMSTEKRLATLRGLSAQAYLLQDDYEDPIMDAIMLSRELEKCRNLEPAMADKYEEVRQSLGKIPLSLIAECSNDDQVKTILKNPIGASMECAISLPRLRVALDMHSKQFLADRKCQKILLNEWSGEWSDWVLVPQRVQTFRVLSHTLFYPITSLMFVLTLGKYPSSCRIPFARYLSVATSHFVFLICLLFNMQYKEMRDQRGPPDLLLKKVLYGYIWLYVAGDFFVTLTDIWRLGFRRFFDVWWRCYIVIMTFIYILNFHAFCIAWVRVLEEDLPKAHRSHWDPKEPTLIFEIFFAAASIMSTWRMFYFMQLSRTIGPTVISIGRCVKDIALYLIIMATIIFSFAIGLNYLYEHYKYNTVVRDGTVVTQPYYLASVFTAMRYLYWAFYGYLDPDKMAIVVGTSGPQNTETNHFIIWTAGEILCALYYAVLIVILLQLMVSMMTNTAAKIMEHEDMEWKYICTQLRAEYFEDSRSVAPPFCLLQLFINTVICLVRKCTGGSDKVLSMWDWRYRDPEYTQKDYAKYNDLMNTLTQKVLAKKELKLHHQGSNEKVGEDEQVGGNESWKPGSLLKR